MSKAAVHFACGALGLIPYLSLLFLFHYLGFLLLWDFLKFVALGSTALLIGSDLPDTDARSSPIHEAFTLALPPAIFWGSIYSLGFSYAWAFLLTIASIVLFFEFLPSHRGIIHSVKTGVLFGSRLMLVCYLLGVEIRLSFGLGASLLAGFVLRLFLDGEFKKSQSPRGKISMTGISDIMESQ